MTDERFVMLGFCCQLLILLPVLAIFITKLTLDTIGLAHSSNNLDSDLEYNKFYIWMLVNGILIWSNVTISCCLSCLKELLKIYINLAILFNIGWSIYGLVLWTSDSFDTFEQFDLDGSEKFKRILILNCVFFMFYILLIFYVCCACCSMCCGNNLNTPSSNNSNFFNRPTASSSNTIDREIDNHINRMMTMNDRVFQMVRN